MATATRKSPVPPTPQADKARRSIVGRVVAVSDAIYRFFASLKLAVFSLSSLAAVLAYATFFESWYGTAAVQEWIYQSPGFAILLAFLGTNILCAALIRYPWKKRQTGFVITHAGLLIVLAGSWITLKNAEEGQVAALEGEVKNQLIRTDYPVLRVRMPADPSTQESREFELPFRPGTFLWGPGSPRQRGLFESIAHGVTFGALDRNANEGEVLTRPRDPFKLVVKSFLPASVPAVVHEADPDGVPMVKIRPRFKGPAMPRAMEMFESEPQRWFSVDRRLYRNAKGDRPARIVFAYVDRPELVEDFLSPPKDAGPAGAARFRYKDDGGKTRVFDWKLDDQEGKSVLLPDSDLTVTLKGIAELPTQEAGFSRVLGEPSIQIAKFDVRHGSGPAVTHIGWGSLPMIPNFIPGQEEEGSKGPAPTKGLVEINYFLPPVIDPATNGLFGQIEVLGGPGGKLYSRVFGRGEKGLGKLRSPGPLKVGEEIVAFGGNPKQMTISFDVEEYLPSGRAREVCEPLNLPKNQLGNGLPAAQVEMTVDGKTKELWVRRSPTFDPLWEPVHFPDGDFEIAYDFDRKDLGFNLRLDDFQVGFDPGTDQASSYVSKVRLTDKAEGIDEKPITISMNEPMTNRGYTFYQSSFIRVRDPRTDRETGQFQSVFQVGRDPGRNVKYLGCLLVVLGAFVQFYMRAGLFSDGGKRERERAAARAGNGAPADGVQNETADASEGATEETL
jgi:hypothetical protein